MSMENPSINYLPEEEQEKMALELAEKEAEIEDKFKSGNFTKEELGKLEEERDRLRKEAERKKNEEELKSKTVEIEKQPIKESEKIERYDVLEEQKDFMRGESEQKVLSSKTEINSEKKELTEAEKQEKAERYGFKDINLKNTIAKGFVDTAGSIFGARLAWELPKFVSDIYKKRGASKATLELLDAVTENNKNEEIETSREKQAEEVMSPEEKKLTEEREKNFGEKESRPVREKIASFNEKLKNVKLPEKEKQELRNQMARVLTEHRHSTENIDKKRAEKVGKVFDVYASNSAQVMTVAREVVNTASIFAMMPWLRGVGYSALAGASSVMKASNIYDKEHFADKSRKDLLEKAGYSSDKTDNSLQNDIKSIEQEISGAHENMSNAIKIFGNEEEARKKDVSFVESEKLKNELSDRISQLNQILESDKKENKLSYIAKAITIGEAKETYTSLIANFYKKNEKGEKMGFRKALLGSVMKAVSVGGGALRMAGIVEFEHALASGNLAMAEGGQKFMEALKGGHINEVLKQGSENWMNNAQRLLSYVGLSDNPDKAMNGLVKGTTSEKPIKLENNPQLAPAETPADLKNNLPHAESSVDAEKIKELATIRKGEGVIHTFTRQIEHDPKSFGFQGDMSDKVALHKFAQSEAYKVAVENKYVDLDKGTEIRVLDDKEPVQFILHRDHSIQEVNPHTYIENTNEATKKTLDEADKVARHVSESTGTKIDIHHEVDNSSLHNNTEKNFVEKHQTDSINNKHLHEEVPNHLEKLSEEKVTLNNNTEVRFSYDNKHEIIGVAFKGSQGMKEYVERESYLRDDYYKNLFSVPGINHEVADRVVRTSLSEIYVYKNVLNKLVLEGKENSQEAMFLKEVLKHKIGLLESKYCKIFKDLPEILKINSK